MLREKMAIVLFHGPLSKKALVDNKLQIGPT
jgi:hypothetical protein